MSQPEILSCPACGEKCRAWTRDDHALCRFTARIRCIDPDCYEGPKRRGNHPEAVLNQAIHAHNRIAGAVAERAHVAQLREALAGVVRVADRATMEFDAAREALAATDHIAPTRNGARCAAEREAARRNDWDGRTPQAREWARKWMPDMTPRGEEGGAP